MILFLKLSVDVHTYKQGYLVKKKKKIRLKVNFIGLHKKIEKLHYRNSISKISFEEVVRGEGNIYIYISTVWPSYLLSTLTENTGKQKIGFSPTRLIKHKCLESTNL